MATQSSTKQSTRRNILAVKIPGLTDEVKIEFPTRRLPSCEKCKRQYKTRELCRVQKRHETLPWTTVNICITLDHSCLDNEHKIASDTFLSRTVGWQPYKFKEGAIDVKMLMCADCKNKNYTRSACRGKEKYCHRHLPWNTVYCEFSALPPDPAKMNDSGLLPSEINNTKKLVSTKEEHNDSCNEKSSSSVVKKEEKSETADDNISSEDQKEKHDEIPPSSTPQKEKIEDNGENLISLTKKETDSTPDKAEIATESNPNKKPKLSVDKNNGKDPNQAKCNMGKLIDFSNVDRSRTFFLEVSCKSLNLQWLDFDDNVTQSHRYGARFNLQQDFTRHRVITSSEADNHWYPQANFYPPQMLGFNPYFPFNQMYGLQQQLRQQTGPFSNLIYNPEQLANSTPNQIAPTIQNISQSNPNHEDCEAQLQMQRHYPV